ncbi:CDGSH iron-sulfur domain-containing protein [Streptomyces sp. 9-7]|uniref:CDGSH iron-sulfur domain-containing protein n=2 Tax=Streptomyces siderophoricus TaxID=2802281 RepID=A0ABS1MQ38_9ACTN|nr:CDGSH iron-sulfur domain-containing protein [Streptomyces sp. 9-7]
MLVEGPVEVVCDDGSVAVSDRFVVALCTCRRSHSYPWCDTSHRHRARPTTKPGPTPEPSPTPEPGSTPEPSPTPESGPTSESGPTPAPGSTPESGPVPAREGDAP